MPSPRRSTERSFPEAELTFDVFLGRHSSSSEVYQATIDGCAFGIGQWLMLMLNFQLEQLKDFRCLVL